MKKYIALILAALLTLSLAACGGNDSNASDGDQPYTPTSALDMLQVVWDGYGEEETFYAVGGDYSEENGTEGAPGVYDLTDRTVVDSVLGLPETALVDEAASLVHGMNSNTFTAGAYHATDDARELASALRDNIQQRQWMCGFPDRLVVAVVGEYVLGAYGAQEQMDTFVTHFSGIYGTSAIVYDEAIQ